MGMFDYLSDLDRLVDVTEAVMENKIMHLEFEFNKLMLEHKENMLAINTKIIMESGTLDDMTDLYLFEAEETKEKGKGIIGSIFSAVGKFFKKIREILFGVREDIKDKDIPDKGVEVPNDPNKLMKEGNDVIGGVKSFLSGNKGKLAGVLAAVGGTAGAVLLSKDKVSSTIDNLIEYAKTIDESIVEINAKVEDSNTPAEDLPLLKKAANTLMNIGHNIGAVVKAIPKMGSEDYKDIAEKNKKERDEAKAKAKDEKKEEMKNRKDSLDDNKIKKSIEAQDRSASKIDVISKKLSDLKAKKKKLEEELKKAKKDKGGDGSLLSNLKASSEQKELEKLENIPRRNRSEKQQDRYLDLLQKYGAENIRRNSHTTTIEAELNGVKKEISNLEKKIENRTAEAKKAREIAIKTDIKKTKREVKESVELDSELEELLDLL